MTRPRYHVEIVKDLAKIEPLWTALAARGPGADIAFQDFRWLSLWYEMFGDRRRVEPLIAVIREGDGGAAIDNVAMIAPLVRRWKYGLPVVEFADRGVTDYNVAVEGPRRPRDPASMTALFDALKRAARPFALLRLSKIPSEIKGVRSPFAMLDEAAPCRLEGHVLALPRSVDALLAGHFGAKKVRALRRAERLVEALGETRFGLAATPQERLELHALIRDSQGARIPRRGERYLLENEGYRQFYDELVTRPDLFSLAPMFGIWLDGTAIAGALTVRRGDRLIALRVGFRSNPDLMRVGPGRLVLMKTAIWAVEQGLAVFDLSIGANDMKAWFHAEPFALVEVRSLANGLLSGRPFGSRRASRAAPSAPRSQ